MRRSLAVLGFLCAGIAVQANESVAQSVNPVLPEQDTTRDRSHAGRTTDNDSPGSGLLKTAGARLRLQDLRQPGRKQDLQVAVKAKLGGLRSSMECPTNSF